MPKTIGNPFSVSKNNWKHWKNSSKKSMLGLIETLKAKELEDIEVKLKDMKEKELAIRTNTEILKIQLKDSETKFQESDLAHRNAEMVTINKIEE